jgi:hypothetical protein
MISGWHAVAFFTRLPPPESLIRSVSATRSVGGGRVSVRVRSTAALQGIRAEVQVGAVCSGGS